MAGQCDRAWLKLAANGRYAVFRCGANGVASKLAVLSTIALASTERRNAAVMKIVRISIGRNRPLILRVSDALRATVTLHENMLRL